jgi:hypothetical protein
MDEDTPKKPCGCPTTVGNRELTTVTTGKKVFCMACDRQVG